MSPDAGLLDRLRRHGQEHLLRWWGELDDDGRARLASDVASIDFEQLDRLIAELVQGEGPGSRSADRVSPIEAVRLPQTDGERVAIRRAAALGGDALAAGEVGVILVAGGSGTRLGFEGPKGTFPIGPVSSASLFQIHAEKIVALIATASSGRAALHHDQPREPPGHGRLLRGQQSLRPGARPVLRAGADAGCRQGERQGADRREGPRRALAPTATAGRSPRLAAPGPGGTPSCLEEMRGYGVRTLFYFQVDNPLVQIADPAFLGLHRQAGAEMSFKVVERLAPGEKLGVVVRVDGKPQVIEYSDLPADLAARREPEGRLELWAGSIAVHILECSFIERLTGEVGGRLPFHRAIKKVSYVNNDGQIVKPEQPNAVKFEQFIFDALPMAERWTIVETDRGSEFEPLKNAVGPDSPATVHQRMSDLFAGWLEQAGVTVPRRPDGSVPFGVEISPLFALDAAELKSKIQPGLIVDRPVYLH